MGYRCVVRAWWTLALSFGFACVLLATVVAAGGDAGPPGSLASDASTDRVLPREAALSDRAVPLSHTMPDPPALSERKQWIFDLRYDHGDVYLLGMHQVDLTSPQPTPRAMGRFAVELFEGPTLVERARFDFPMLMTGGIDAGADAGKDKNRVDFDRKLVSRIGVMFPATSRGNRLELWDRGTEQRWSLPWPPTDTRGDPAKDARKDGGKQ
jgi:hypothetical protein